MFWRFGFHNGSSIDSLLDKDDVSLEAIMDEEDVLQECKAQNTRLIDYFQRVDVLKRLIGHVTGQIESEEQGRYKYPYVATEILCSEIWSIVETCFNNTEQLMVPFWETVLDRSAEDMKTEMVMATHFAKINAVFLTKKPAEMLEFIWSQPSVVERLLQHIETPAFSDLLLRIIQLDEQPAGAGVLEWLAKENLMARLIGRLSPSHSPDMHTVVAELIKNIISMAAPSPGAGLTEGLSNGPASNRFARELAQRDNVQTLVEYILDDFSGVQKVEGKDKEGSGAPVRSVEAEQKDAKGKDKDKEENEDEDEGMKDDDESDHDPPDILPSLESSTSSVVNSICIIIELIRQNNSDYFEPYLFHTLRNRLIQIQQQLQPPTAEESRETLERSMREMVDRMGVVHLGPVLEIFCDRLDQVHKYLKAPRSLTGPVSTTLGSITPLTFERYRICELYAELLHCSSMSLLNRPAEYNYLYDSEGRLQGGLSALEDLARVISMNAGEDRDQDVMDEDADEIEPAMELPVHGASHDSSSLLDSDDDMSDGDEPNSSDDDDAMEDIAMEDDPPRPSSRGSPSTTASSGGGGGSNSGPPSPIHIRSPVDFPPVFITSSPSHTSSPIPIPLTDAPTSLSPVTLSPATDIVPPILGPRRRSSASLGSDSGSTKGRQSRASRRSSRRLTVQDVKELDGDVPAPVGERIKQKFLDVGVIGTLLDLFFEFPWNNFLHSVVYDLIHQILTGRVDAGVNRALTISLFEDAKLMSRIVEGQRRNDAESAKPKGVRLGYMGHLTLISEDVITALEHFPPDLRLIIAKFAPQPDWDEYVTGRYNETKKRDQALLGGGKPVVSAGSSRPGSSQWKVDEEDTSGGAAGGAAGGGGGGGGGGSTVEEDMQGEFRRATGARPTRENSADFGPAPIEEDDEDFSPAGHPTFARYLAQEMHSPDEFGGSSSSSDASDDEDGGWLSQSNFELDRPPPVSTRPRLERRPLSESGFDDAFRPPEDTSSRGPFHDPFADDEDDAFGPFSDTASAATTSGSDPFTFPSNLSGEDVQGASFDNFGDFGDFHSADGETTPTAGSWTFEGGSSTSSEVDDVLALSEESGKLGDSTEKIEDVGKGKVEFGGGHKREGEQSG